MRVSDLLAESAGPSSGEDPGEAPSGTGVGIQVARLPIPGVSVQPVMFQPFPEADASVVQEFITPDSAAPDR